MRKLAERGHPAEQVALEKLVGEAPGRRALEKLVGEAPGRRALFAAHRLHATQVRMKASSAAR